MDFYGFLDSLGTTGPLISFFIDILSIVIALYSVYFGFTYKGEKNKKRLIVIGLVLLLFVCLPFLILASFGYREYTIRNDVLETRKQITEVKERLYNNHLYEYYTLVENGFDTTSISQRARNTLQNKIKEDIEFVERIKCYQNNIDWRIVNIYQMDQKAYLLTLDASLEYLNGDGDAERAVETAKAAIAIWDQAKEEMEILNYLHTEKNIDGNLSNYLRFAGRSKSAEMRLYIKAWAMGVPLLCGDDDYNYEDFTNLFGEIRARNPEYLDKYPPDNNRILHNVEELNE